jgi:hypothetical protein
MVRADTPEGREVLPVSFTNGLLLLPANTCCLWPVFLFCHRGSGTALTWAAIASTYEASAIANIGSFGVPVYLASGTLVSPSDTQTGLWSGSLQAPINEFLTDPFFLRYERVDWNLHGRIQRGVVHARQ